MTTYLLHGGMLKDKNASNEAYFRRIVRGVPDGGTVLIVLFAATEDRWPELFEELKGAMEAQTEGKPLQFVCATKKRFVEEAKHADAIVIRGGSTDRLLDALRSYDDLGRVFAGKLVGGSSAGAYAIAAYNYDRSARECRAGFGLLPLRVICHYESPTSDGAGPEAVEIMNGDHADLPLLLLHDCEWKEYTV